MNVKAKDPMKKLYIVIIVISFLALIVASTYIFLVIPIRGAIINHHRDALLSEGSVWIDQTGQYKIIFDKDQFGGTITDTKNGEIVYGFYFIGYEPGTIILVEVDPTDTDAVFSEQEEYTYVFWKYDKEKDMITINDPEYNFDYVSSDLPDELIFVREENDN